MRQKLSYILLISLMMTAISGCATTHSAPENPNTQDGTDTSNQKKQTVEHTGSVNPFYYIYYLLFKYKDCQ